MIYRQLLKDDFERLPPALQRFHSMPGGGRASGTVSVRHSNRLLARLAGFPHAGDNIPLRLDVHADDERELWMRRFGDDLLLSTQRCANGLLVERFGPLRLEFHLSADDAGLRLTSRTVSFWGLPLPLRVRAAERPHGHGWDFEVSVAGVGSYHGTMEPLP
jgi:hypothetical protein